MTAAVDRPRLLIWSVEETTGFDSAWASLDGSKLVAEGRACGLQPYPYWIEYRLETADDYMTHLMVVSGRWAGGSAALELRRDDGTWTENGEVRPDLDAALDCDLGACPLTNTMPILRHGLHQHAADEAFAMAFIEVPGLRVVASKQRYTHLRLTDDGAIVRYRSGSFQSDLAIDRDGFVVDYPTLGHRLAAAPARPGIRAAGAGSARPDDR